MSLILQIETATTSCSVALASDGKTIAVQQIDGRNLHAEVITRFIETLVTETGLSYKDLDAIAVSCGPGSYTGLRIGISTAKGLCYALDKPLIAIETLESMAFGAISYEGININEDQLLCPMIDARRMEVYTALFNSKGERIRGTSAAIIDENSFADVLTDKRILFFGDGAEKCFNVLSKNANAGYLPNLSIRQHIFQKKL